MWTMWADKQTFTYGGWVSPATLDINNIYVLSN